ncbi:MAG: hypothetical protein ACOVOR_05250 [Rhabdochlamydiaceae bacterium]
MRQVQHRQKQMDKPRKSYFSLIELTIALALLLILASTVGWNIKNLINSHKNSSAFSKFQSKLYTMKFLALTHSTYINLKIYKKSEDIFYKFFTDEPFLVFDQSAYLLTSNGSLIVSKMYKQDHTLIINDKGEILPTDHLEITFPKDPLNIITKKEDGTFIKLNAKK